MDDTSRTARPDGPDPARYPARAVVDLAAIRDNVRALRGHAGSAEVMAVVKADAYGHGLLPSALAALAGGATWLSVAQPSEALALRAAGLGPDRSRLVAWLFPPGAPLRALIEADVDVSVAACWALDDVAAAARAAERPARVHLEVDTGLGRNGVMPTDLPAVLASAVRAEAEGVLRVVGIWSHLACADEPGHPSIAAQAEVFDDAVRLAERSGLAPDVRHLANSAATLTAPRTRYDLVRPGLAVYGMSPVPQLGPPAEHGLTPAMTLEARLATVKQVGAGQGVSYGGEYTTTGPTVLGVVPLGYADGIPRHASSGPSGSGPGGPVLVGGPDAGRRVLRVRGRVCMDQLVLDLGPGATERAGDVVTLFGAGTGLGRGGTPIAEDWAQAAGTIGYEITTRLGGRVPREHVGLDVLDDAARSLVRAATARPGAANATAAAPTGSDPTDHERTTSR
ncbi:alanine racemase [Cellulosimicrobium arenosum]|uniref:Alanine racemase n=1 Tax=Cellulosimicrobium arenosum TaxID=2708133 RepID=A0A927J2L6_9MICO|nr:alanine racemase [Cellulosimicrobium arenosum]